MEFRKVPLFLVTDPTPAALGAEITAFRLQMAKGLNDCSTMIREQIHQTCARALPKEPHELTEEERFAIAFCAGVPLQQTLRHHDDFELGDRFRMRTVPCAITKHNGQWRVGYDGRDHYGTR